MNFLDAAHIILRLAGRPLHYDEITKRGLQQGILVTAGKTPAATMGSRLYTDTKKPDSRFKRVGKGTFTLADRSEPDDDIAKQVAKINGATRKQLRQQIATISPQLFEVLVEELLKQMGFEEETVRVTPYSNDQGVDVRGILNTGIGRVSVAVQVKRQKGNVQRPVVQQLRGSLKPDETGVIITTGGFSKGARDNAGEPGLKPINLTDGDQLVELLIEHRVGVEAEQHTVFVLDDAFWSEFVAEEQGHGAGGPESAAGETESAASLFPLTIAGGKSMSVQAQLLDGFGRVLLNGIEYQSPSGAAKAASSQSVNGWTYWKYLDQTSGKWLPIKAIRPK